MSDDSWPVFNQFLDTEYGTAMKKKAVKPPYIRKFKSQINVTIEGIINQDGETLLLSMTDITKLQASRRITAPA
jgi:hypothetical protein